MFWNKNKKKEVQDSLKEVLPDPVLSAPIPTEPQIEPDALFSPGEVLIYRHATIYTDEGIKFVLKDPVDLWRRLTSHGNEISNAVKVAYSPSKFANDARVRLYSRIREVFEIPLPSEGGLSETHLGELMSHFLAYAETVKKKLPPPSISRPVTFPGMTDYAETEEESPQATGNGSATGSIVAGCSIETPG